MNAKTLVSEKRRLSPISPRIFFAVLFFLAVFIFSQNAANAAVAYGTSGAVATGSTSLSVPYPGSIAAGDLLVLAVGNKYPTNGPATPAGWTLVTNGQGSGGAGAAGTDSGTIYSTVFVKEADGTESGNLAITLTGANTSMGRMFRYSKAAGTAWDYAATNGSDNSAGTAWSVTGAANPGITSGDMLVVASAINSDAPAFSAESVSATGATFGTNAERQDSGSTTGNDMRLVVSDHTVTAGTASAAPVFTMTGSATAGNYPAGASVILRIRESPATTLDTGTDPAAATIAPGAAVTDVNDFTLQTSSGTEAITSVTVNLSTNSGIGRLAITNNAGTELGFTTSPVTGSNTITVSGMTATTTLTTFKVRVTPLSHAAMPVPPGGAYAITAPVTAWAGSLAHTGSDTNANALTIDNLSPSGATSVSGTAGTTEVNLNWTTSASADFSRSVVLRWAGSSAGAQVPIEGTDYVNGNTIGTATVVCVRTTDATSTTVGDVDGAGTGNCSATPLTIGQAYTYKIFQKDSNGNYDVGVALGTFTPVPMVVSINRADVNPTSSGTSVSWTVVFGISVTGVDSGDFALVQAGGVSGASISSVSGSGTTWTVTVNTGTGTGTLGLNLVDNDSIVDGSGNKLGGTGAGNGNFTGQVYTITPPCLPPNNVPAGVTVSCQCDNFGRASLNPSTIFGTDWTLSLGSSDATGLLPRIVNSGYMRLTDDTANNAKAATVPGIFPAAGNYISVEFNHYAYRGTATGADGIAVTLSDYSIPAVPGGFGGSLGYAQRSDGTQPPGFAGGWVGVALDEYGNFQNPTEGRVGGPGFIVQSVSVRGPGNGANGYRYMGGTGSNPGTPPLRIDTANRTSTTPGPGYMFQVVVDARNSATGFIYVTVNRDSTTKDGTTFETPSLFGPFNAYTEANFALTSGWISQIVPDFWKISFTGSTGGSNNIHEIGGLRICAQSVYPPTGGTASGFAAIDEAYPVAPSSTVPAYQNFQTGNIYMKLAGTSFKLWVAALTGTGISGNYSAFSNKYLAVKFVDNSDNACGPDSARTCNAACTNKTAVESGASQIVGFTSSDPGAKQSPSFTLNSAWKNLVAVMKECTTSACAAFTATAPACSADSFSVRPTGIASVTSSNATNTGTGGTPIFKAGSDAFSLTATTTGIAGNPSGYTGVLKINNAAIQTAGLATVIGTLAPTSFPAAASGTPSSTATGNTFTYSEVGGFYFRGYNPASDVTSPRGVYDGVATATECASPVTPAQCDILRAATWMGVDSITSKGDCVQNNYSNSKDAAGKYGCSFGIVADTGAFGRFTPHHFDVSMIHGCAGGAAFTYSGQPFTVTATARNSAGVTTRNYHGLYNLSKDTRISNAGTTTYFTPNNNTTSNNDLAAASFTDGVGTQSAVTYTFPVTSPPKETAPTTLTLRAIDTDNVSSVGYTEAPAEIRSGRVRIQNAYDSELAALPVPMRVEYYSTDDGWLTNAADTCTSVPATGLSLANNVSPSPVTPPTAKTVGSQTTTATVANSPFFLGSGDAGLSLSAPGQGGDGYVDITANLSAKPWLRFDWNGTGDVDPTGRASFGLYRGSPRHIYLRQRYN